MRTLNDSVQYFAVVTAVNRAGLNASARGLPVRVDTKACVFMPCLDARDAGWCLL